MNLKEAFQAQNRLSELLTYIGRYISDDDNNTIVTEKHLKAKALAGQQDETVDVSRKDEDAFEVTKLLDIWQQVMREKEKLSLAIGKAKTGMDFNLDAAVDTNKSRRAFLTVLQRLSVSKSSHELQKGEGRGYVFNKDGNQTEYCYDIDRIVTIDYDRNKVREMAKALHRKAEEVSLKIDEALLKTKVDYTLPFDLSGDNRLIIEEMLAE
ncbi:MAG: formate dehydrogenase [Selenomonadaceae bacterium]|nr:formate dehydrogenase [Selenomonadaceae bacterium]